MNDASAVSQRPPVDVEQCLDLVIALASHRSHVEAQRQFGQVLIQRYFVALPEAVKDDPVARTYLDNILCLVGSAVRGFSVVRDGFQGQWDALKEAKARETERAERLDGFSPFKKDGYWRQAITVAGALGLSSIVLSAFQKTVTPMPARVALMIAAAVVVGLILVELAVDWLRNRRLARVAADFPEDLMDVWRSKALQGYRTVAKQFILQAIKVREEFYPGLTTIDHKRVFDGSVVPHIDFVGGLTTDTVSTINDLDGRIAAIVEQHFAFKPSATGTKGGASATSST